MSTKAAKQSSRSGKQALLRKKLGRPKMKTAKELIQNAGLWEGRKDISAEQLREQAWKRN